MQAQFACDSMTIMGSQIRAARALLRLTLQDLATASGVSVATIIRAEKVDGEPTMTRANLAALRRALEDAGAVFLPDGGVRPRKLSGEGHPT
ncbi:helix-turn-helix domain-containing protein [Paracraurococcus lichenis]|uniref:helix-turn-helix domain-containing protein n=1 Tax=Paracraurococcus lichenis TaxID=3064888 RepID=UPI00351CE5B1